MSKGKTDLAWLFARPIAHRGLHDRAKGIVENTASAARAAAARGFAIECDVQLTSDGDAVVFHDFALDRLAKATGPVAAHTAAALREIVLRNTSDQILPLGDFLALIGGRVPVIVEIKSAFNGDTRLAARTADIVADAKMPIALKSFDPAILEFLRTRAVNLGGTPVGIVAEADYSQGEWARLPSALKAELVNFLHFERSRPDFVSWSVGDLPHPTPCLCRAAIGLPVMAWTVRTAESAASASKWVDQIVFEGFDPDRR